MPQLCVAWWRAIAQVKGGEPFQNHHFALAVRAEPDDRGVLETVGENVAGVLADVVMESVVA